MASKESSHDPLKGSQNIGVSENDEEHANERLASSSDTADSLHTALEYQENEFEQDTDERHEQPAAGQLSHDTNPAHSHASPSSLPVAAPPPSQQPAATHFYGGRVLRQDAWEAIQGLVGLSQVPPGQTHYNPQSVAHTLQPATAVASRGSSASDPIVLGDTISVRGRG